MITATIVLFVALTLWPLTALAICYAKKHRQLAVALTCLMVWFGVGMNFNSPPPPPQVEIEEHEEENAPDDEPK